MEPSVIVPQKMLELQRETRSSIEMKMSAKGERYWDIKVYFEEGDQLVGVETIKFIDVKLRELFLVSES